jgi:hypothetical protein
LALGAAAADCIKAAEERLAIARRGLHDMKDPIRSISGLYNVAVFGRMVTFALQNMKNQVDGFDQWYAPIEADLRSDELANYFKNLRTDIEKTAKQNTGGYVRINKMTGKQMSDLTSSPPPGAESFFMGDTNGGSGWIVVLPDGTKEKYYTELPPDLHVETGLVLPNAPEKFRQVNAKILAAEYLDKISGVVEDAKKRFGYGTVSDHRIHVTSLFHA